MLDTVTIRIRNREFSIKGPDAKEHVIKAAEYVDRKLKEIDEANKGLSDDRVAVLAALDIAGDFFQLVREKEDLLGEINGRSKRLIKSLTTVLG